MTEFVLPYTLDEYFTTKPMGSLERSISRNLYGFNHMQVNPPMVTTGDMLGMTFFTRPQLNMQLDNIRNLRLFMPLTTTEEKSIQRWVRCALDPRIIEGYRYKRDKTQPATCSLIDNKSAFFAPLTNNLISLTGWPDMVAPTFTSTPGLYNEEYSMVDGIVSHKEAFDLDASFQNSRGDVILYLFYVWLNYMSAVFEGILVPYPDFISENEIDYNTRIYRVVLDTARETVVKIAATGASFPISVPTGNFFDYTNEKLFLDRNEKIQVRFKCMGVDYMDDILVHEFNETVCIFNPDMRDEYRTRNMVVIPKGVKHLFNNRGYPRIDPSSYAFEWWIEQDKFKAIVNYFNSEKFDGHNPPTIQPNP